MNLMRFWTSVNSSGSVVWRSLTRLGFVDQVDGLIGKKTVGNIAVGMRDGKIDGVVGVGDGVEFFVAFFYAKENLDGVDFVGRRNLYAWKRRSSERSFSMDLRYSRG